MVYPEAFGTGSNLGCAEGDRGLDQRKRGRRELEKSRDQPQQGAPLSCTKQPHKGGFLNQSQSLSEFLQR